MLLLIPIVFIIIGILMWKLEILEFEFVPVGGVITWIGVAVLGGMLIGVPIAKMETNVDVAGFLAVKASVEQARLSDVSDLELAALQHKIVEQNMLLARKLRYANSPWFRIYYTKGIFELEPIK